MRCDYQLAFVDIRDCHCGLRYARQVIGLSQTQIGEIACICGESLEVWRGRYWLDFEPEERTEPVN